MYRVVRRLNEYDLEGFGTYEFKEQAETEAQIIKHFLGYDTFVIEIE